MSFEDQTASLTWPCTLPLAGPWNGIRPRPAMTPMIDTLLVLALYPFATCCSHRVIFPLL